MAVFPLRVVYMKMEGKKDAGENEEKIFNGENGKSGDMPPVSILVSVPKRRFRHAVDRNRMKRLVRESYRLNKHILWKAMEGKEYRLAVAFVCITDTLPSFPMVKKSVMKALIRMSERLS